MIGKRRPLVLAGLLALAFGGVAAGSAPAHAVDLTSMSCSGWTYTTYSPGLTNTVQTTTVVDEGYYDVITANSPTGACPAVGSGATSGRRDVTATLSLSCNALLTETGVETIDWNDGRSTSFPFTAVAAHIGSNTVLTETGTVDQGEFDGDSVVETFTAPNLDFAACDTPAGVTSLDYLDTLLITPQLT
jgi:hypothetical protein